MKIKCLPEFDAPDASQAPDKFLRRDLAEAVSQVILLGGGGVDQGHEDGQLGEAGAGNQLAEHQVKLVLDEKFSCQWPFFAPTGAHAKVRPCVCVSEPNLSRAVNLHLSRSESSQSIPSAIREQSESIQRALRALKSKSYSRSLKSCLLGV